MGGQGRGEGGVWDAQFGKVSRSRYHGVHPCRQYLRGSITVSFLVHVGIEVLFSTLHMH